MTAAGGMVDGDAAGRLGGEQRPRHADPVVARIVAAFEALDAQGCDRLADLYAPDARFTDPFQSVRGHARIVAVYRHMFDHLDAPRFRVTRVVGTPGESAWVLFWDFHYRFRRPLPAAEQVTPGSSLLELDPAGRIAVHTDYWDPAAGLYERLPLVGALMRWLRRRMT